MPKFLGENGKKLKKRDFAICVAKVSREKPRKRDFDICGAKVSRKKAEKAPKNVTST